MRVAENFLLALEPGKLRRAGRGHLRPQRGGIRARGFLRQFVVGERRHLDVDVDSVKKRTLDLRHVLLDLGLRAGAFVARVREVPARTGVRRSFPR